MAVSFEECKAGNHEAHAQPSDQPHAIYSLSKVLKQPALVEQQYQVVEARDVAVLRQDRQDGQHCVYVRILEHQQSGICPCRQQVGCNVVMCTNFRVVMCADRHEEVSSSLRGWPWLEIVCLNEAGGSQRLGHRVLWLL